MDLLGRVFLNVLQRIVMEDQNYAVRNGLVLRALAVAVEQGLSAGIRIDPAEPDWPCVFIELPTGQVSWHIPQHPTVWDGHTTEQKFERIRKYVDAG